MTSGHKDFPRASQAVVVGGIIIFIAGMFLLISFASPYWVESYSETFSDFKHMGLWEYCFENFRFPYHQFPKRFSGCHYVYSFEYYVIREWLLPGWLLAVQTFVTLSLMASLFSQVMIALVVTRYPLRYILSYEWLLSGMIFGCQVAVGFLLLIAVSIFWTQSDRRDWLMYPTFNHLSWSYYFCLVSWLLHCLGGAVLYKDFRSKLEHRDEAKNLVRQMYPPEEHHNGFI